jgi:hypothetical protein
VHQVGYNKLIKTDKFIRIAQGNSNGLQNHKEEIKLFLKQNFTDTCILLNNEPHFTTKNYFSIPRYKLHYTHHPDGTGHGGTYKRNNRTLWIVKIWRRLHSGYVNKSERISIWDNNHSRLLPTRHNLKNEHFETFFQTLGPKFIDGGDYNSKHTLWGSRLTTTKVRELLKVIQEKNYSFL